MTLISRPRIDGSRLTEVELRLARWVRERHEDFGRRLLPAPNLITDHRDLSGVAVLLAKPFEDSLAGVALLRMNLLIGLQNLVNDWNELSNLRFDAGSLPAIAGWLLIFENLLDRPEIQIELLARSTPAHAAREYVAADPCPLVHVGNHSFPSRS